MHPEMERAKARYHQQEVPEELSLTVRAAIREGNQRRKRRQTLRRSLATALASCACFVLLVNGSPSFAQAVYEVPVLGSLAKIFTVTEYTINDDERVIDVRLPALENTGHTDLEQQINQEISTRIQAVIDAAEARARETKEAYVATGGDPDDYMPVIIDVDYEVKCQNEQYLSFVVTETETRASAYTEFYTYNIDLETGKELSLRDLLGPNWMETVNAQVAEQIAERAQDPDNIYWTEEQGGFQGIEEDQPFYLNADGLPVVVFEKYEIATGSMGSQEFVIQPKNQKDKKSGALKGAPLFRSGDPLCVRFHVGASQSSAVRRRRNQFQSVFSGDMCVGKNSAQPASVRVGDPDKPSEAGLSGRGGARERSETWPPGQDEHRGLCPDEVRCSRLHPFEKMLAFLRASVGFADRRKSGAP